MALTHAAIFALILLFSSPLIHAKKWTYIPKPLHLSPLQSFLTCLPKTFPVHLPSTTKYDELAARSFRSNITDLPLKRPSMQQMQIVADDRNQPLAIVLAENEHHIQIAVKCAHQARLSGVCARSGGHSLVGKSICGGGILIDVGLLRGVKFLGGDVVEIEAGINMGELLWKLHEKGLWYAAGVCPQVGVGGYVFGGGHGPYEGRLGMACDVLKEVHVVDRKGRMVVAKKDARSWKARELFWGLCGAGGGQFGIVTRFKVKAAKSRPFDRAVIFRFNWPLNVSGELMRGWVEYDEDQGNTWFRMEMGLSSPEESGMFGYGACHDVDGIDECMARLKKADFFNTPGRTTVLLEKAKSALDVHGFYGPEGGWARKLAPDLKKAFLEQRFNLGGDANGRTYQSTFFKKKGKFGNLKPPSAKWWQRYVDFCADPGRKSIPWVVCELNLFNNAIDIPRDSAFAHRDAHIITHYIVGGGSTEDRAFVYYWMKNHFAPYTSGVYVNYPELELGKEYPWAYWGKNLPRLQRLKRVFDPYIFFKNLQPIPPARYGHWYH